jgi:hypothetical protein
MWRRTLAFIEKRVAAVKCLATSNLPYMSMLNLPDVIFLVARANNILGTTDAITANFLELLNDYTTDRRGDIGSLIRVEAIQAAGILLQREPGSTSHSPLVQNLAGNLCRLASEKLDKVRLHAWLCLQGFWESAEDLPPLET